MQTVIQPKTKTLIEYSLCYVTISTNIKLYARAVKEQRKDGLYAQKS